MKSDIMNLKTKFELGNWTYDAAFGSFMDKAGEEFFLDQRLNQLLLMLIRAINYDNC